MHTWINGEFMSEIQFCFGICDLNGDKADDELFVML